MIQLDLFDDADVYDATDEAELERQSIADLYDGVVQSLANVTYSASTATEFDQAFLDALQDTADTISHFVAEYREQVK